jgi:UDP-N-acetylmuramyl pentapeptide phosphotransferase/UDP-N-acetylglucosamine-1-phosphate transferase
MHKSMTNLFRLGWQDLLKGLVVAVIMAILTVAYEDITTEGNFDWKKILIASIGAGLAYLIKNFSSDNQGNLLGVK